MKIKEYRKNKGYTQKEIALMLGIKQNTYSDKELGKSKFTIDEVKKLKEILEVTYDDLLN